MANKTSSKSTTARQTSTKSMKKSTSRSTKSARAKTTGDAVGSDEVSVDRRRTERRDGEVATVPAVAAPQLERRKKVNRRRQIDPTTCERDYTDQEVEFMNSLDDYKRKSGRMFPTCSEVLEVLHGLGYVKLSATEMSAMPTDSSAEASAKPMPSDWQGSNDADDSECAVEFACEPHFVH